MLNIAHTAAPWSVCDDGTKTEPMLKVVGRTARHEVALCCTGAVPQEEETANAQLIAAAPELLQELRASLCPGGGWNGMPERLEGIATVQDCLDAGVCGCSCGAAVLKATGGSQR